MDGAIAPRKRIKETCPFPFFCYLIPMIKEIASLALHAIVSYAVIVAIAWFAHAVCH